MNQRKGNVKLRVARPALEREVVVAAVALLIARENSCASLRRYEAPVFRHADRHDVDALLRRGADHRSRREDRHFVLGGAAAEDERGTDHCGCSRSNE